MTVAKKQANSAVSTGVRSKRPKQASGNCVTKYYSFHDIVRLVVTSRTKHFNRVDNEFGFYECAPFAESQADLHLRLGPFHFDDQAPGIMTVDKKYRVLGHDLYAEDRYKVASWRILLEGLGQPLTTMSFDGNRFHTWVLIKLFLEPLIRIKFELKGYSMIHSCCIGTPAGCVVFAASPSVGKTTMLLKFLEHTPMFISDEYSIIKDNIVYSYVTPFRFHYHNLQMNADILSHMSPYDRFQVWWRTKLLHLTKGYADVTWNTSLSHTLPNVEVLQSAPLKRICTLTKSITPDIMMHGHRLESLAQRLVTINQFEMRIFLYYLKAFAYVHPQSDVARLWELQYDNFIRNLKGQEPLSIEVPQRLSPAHARRLIELSTA